MKNTVCLLLFVSTVSATGCSGLGSFDVPIALSEQRVEGSPLGGLFGGLFAVPIPLDVDIEAETAARDTGPAQHVRLVALSLAITPTAVEANDSDDVDFIESADIYVESASPGSQLPRVRIAHVSDVPEGADTISFETDDNVDLLPYVETGARLTSEARGTVPPDDVTFVGAVVLAVELF